MSPSSIGFTCKPSHKLFAVYLGSSADDRPGTPMSTGLTLVAGPSLLSCHMFSPFRFVKVHQTKRSLENQSWLPNFSHCCFKTVLFASSALIGFFFSVKFCSPRLRNRTLHEASYKSSALLTGKEKIIFLSSPNIHLVFLFQFFFFSKELWPKSLWWKSNMMGTWTLDSFVPKFSLVPGRRKKTSEVVSDSIFKDFTSCAKKENETDLNGEPSCSWDILLS